MQPQAMKDEVGEPERLRQAEQSRQLGDRVSTDVRERAMSERHTQMCSKREIARWVRDRERPMQRDRHRER